ncbi:MAG TPA: response regulator transcription factor [Chloroflexota bacterium]|nr:response regulator transcription factor [Chloroflexota bacterium]
MKVGPETGIILVTDRDLIRGGLRAALTSAPELKVVADIAQGLESLLLAVRNYQPRVLILDARCGGPFIGEVTIAARAQQPSIRSMVIACCLVDEESMLELMDIGIAAFIVADGPGEEIVSAVRAVAAGRDVMDARLPGGSLRRLAEFAQRRGDGRHRQETEHSILRLLVKGYDNARIADELHLSRAAVHWHLGHLFERLGARNRTHAAALAIARGLVAQRDVIESSLINPLV